MEKMMRIWMTVVVILVCLGGSQTVLWAVTGTSDPEIYEITLHQIRMYNQDDSTWYLAGTGDLPFDIASASAGALVGNYISGASLAEGTYSKVEATLSLTFRIQAMFDDLAGTLGGGTWYYYTTAVTTGSGAIVCKEAAPPPPPAEYALGTAVLPLPPATTLPATETIVDGYLVHTETLQTNIIIRTGETRTIRVNFNITNSATFDSVPGPGVVCYPSAPAITITLID